MHGTRALLYLDRSPFLSSLRETLTSLGVEVRAATSFQELSALLLCWRDRTVLLIEPPPIATFRRAVLESIRRLAPTIPVVALVSALTAEVEQDLANERVSGIIAREAALHHVIGELTRTLGVAPAPGSPEDSLSESDAL